MATGCTSGQRIKLPLRRLFTALAAILGVETSAGAAVTSCADDGGFDTLRHAVLAANDGDTIDLSALTCSTITLGSAISTGLYNLGINGPGAGNLTIDGNEADRVFYHVPTGPGTLTISNITVAHGKVTGDSAFGGCIYSKANVVLRNAVVASCTALGQTLAAGGGVTALGDITVYSSVIASNTANAQTGSSGKTSAGGGGVVAGKTLGLYGSTISGNSATAPIGSVGGGGAYAKFMTAKYSTISGNQATSAGTVTDLSSGGGIVTFAKSELLGCTFENNSADAGGAVLIAPYSTYKASIVQTTISGNTGNLGAGAILAQADTDIVNSTIAFNFSGSKANAAVEVGGGNALNLTSSIIADNTPSDLDAGSATVIGGDHDLIKIAGSNVTVPALTITQDPNLLPLAYNGGHTRTHALGGGSIAIGAGSNPASLASDQRGPPYARSVGGNVDIGAYQTDPDHIFGDTFNFGPLF